MSTPADAEVRLRELERAVDLLWMRILVLEAKMQLTELIRNGGRLQ